MEPCFGDIFPLGSKIDKSLQLVSEIACLGAVSHTESEKYALENRSYFRPGNPESFSFAHRIA
jgi:hypothetical protein